MRKRNFPDNITEIQRWKNLYACYKNRKSIVGKIVKYNQYFGFTVDIDGINANMSIRELSYWNNEEPEKFVGNYFSFIITEIDTYQKTLSVSRKKLVVNAKAGDILNGFIIDIEDNYIIVDVGFACRVLKRNLRNYFVKSIDDHFKFYASIKLVLLNDFEKLKYTFASAKESDIWNSIKGKYKEKDIVSASILSISDTGLMLDIDDIVKAFVYKTYLSEELAIKFSERSLSIGECIDVAISGHKDEYHTVECSVRLVDKIRNQIKNQKMVDAFNSISQRGYVYEAEIIDIQRKYAKIRLGEYEGYIEKDSVSWNDIEEIEDILYVGQIVNVVYLADNQDKLTFGIKQLNPQPYDEILYNLDLMGLLGLANVPTTDFIGIARNYGKYTFIEELYSCGEIEGKLLVDPFYGHNLRAIVVNADNVDAGKYYKIKLINLPQKNIRIERNQLFQFQCRIIKEVENPYDKDISEAFQRNTTNPTSNRRDAHLLKEIGKNMYSSKERMFFELIQNADDAAPQKDSVSINSFTTGDYLVFCHDGFSFDKYDFEAITSAAVGTKKANENKTGYKGIGFKSVFTDSKQVYICTNGYHFKFDKEDERFRTFDGFYLNNPFLDTEKAKKRFFSMYSSVRGNFDGVNDIPWQLEPIHVNEFPPEFGKSFMKSNVSIALRLGEKNIQGTGGYESAIDSIVDDPKFMLFLRKTDRIRFNTRTISREINEGIITIKNSFAQNKVERYERFDFAAGVSNEIFEEENLPIRIKIEEREDSGNILKALFVDLEGEQIENIPMKIAISSSTELSFAIPVNEDGSISVLENNTISIFAFLPTLVKDFVFPFYINANFILDPPRQRVLGDSAWNLYLFKVLAEKIVDWSIYLSKRNDRNALNILPYKKFDESSSDISLLAKSFNEAYLSAISNKAFILNEDGEFAKQESIIIDKSGLSDNISHEAFYKLLGTCKRLVSSVLDSKILNKSLFSGIESINEKYILNRLEKDIDIKALHDELNEDDYNSLLSWLSKFPDLSNDIINNLPCFSDGENIWSFNELDVNNFIVLTDKTAPMKQILKKIGFDVYENICPIAFNYSFPSEKDIFSQIKGKIEDKSDIQLTAEEKLTSLKLFLSFDGIAEGACSKIKLFKNIHGETKPLDEMLDYRDDAPKWLHPYMICSEETFEELQKLLKNSDNEFDEVVWPNINDINVSPVEIIKMYSLEGKDIRKFIERCNSNKDLETLMPAIIGKGKETETCFVNKVTRIDLHDNEVYTKDSFTYKTLQMVLANFDKPSEFSKKIFYNNTCITEYSVKDEVVCKYDENGVEKQVLMSLAKLLPQYQNQSGSIEKIKSLFEIKKDLDKFFDAKIKSISDISDELNKYMNIPMSYFSQWKSGSGNAQQYLFATYFRRSIKGWNNAYVPKIALENESYDFVKDLMDFLYVNKISIATSPFTYHIKDYFYNKSLKSNFVLTKECVLETIENWAMSEEKKMWLSTNGVLYKNSKAIRFRILFCENKPVDFLSELSDIEAFAALTFFSSAERMNYPFVGENQIEILQNIKSRKNSPIIERVDTDILYNSSLEWNTSEYTQWKVGRYPIIYLFKGEMPRYFEHNNKKLMTFNEKNYWFDSAKQNLYVNSLCNIDDLLFEIAREGKSGLDLDDYQELCRKGKISVSENTIKAKDEKIAYLGQEIERLKAIKQNSDPEVENHGIRYNRGNLSPEQRKQVSLEACEQAYNYLNDIDGYDCSEWDYSTDGRIVKNVLYNGRKIVVVITSSGGRYIHLNPYAFAQLMENPENLLINVCGNNVRTYSFKELFEENQDVNMIFDSKVVTPKNFAELANKFLTSERTCFVIPNPNYSASDEISGFGLNEKMEGWKVITFSSDDQIW